MEDGFAPVGLSWIRVTEFYILYMHAKPLTNTMLDIAQSEVYLIYTTFQEWVLLPSSGYCYCTTEHFLRLVVMVGIEPRTSEY
jgi:hypothetical protein